jgi:hypothetical protein
MISWPPRRDAPAAGVWRMTRARRAVARRVPWARMRFVAPRDLACRRWAAPLRFAASRFPREAALRRPTVRTGVFAQSARASRRFAPTSVSPVSFGIAGQVITSPASSGAERGAAPPRGALAGDTTATLG